MSPISGRMLTPARSHLICFAVPEESGAFRRAVKGARNVMVIHVGMGRTNARSAIEDALERQTPDRVITAGFAGGLDPVHACGDVVVDADEAFALPEGDAGFRCVAGVFHCADRVATTPREKAAIRTSSKADAVEMESGIIREICGKRGIPSVTVRVISDAAGECLPLDFNALMKPDMSMDFMKLAGALLRSPGKIPELIRFQGRLKTAAANLSQILVRMIEADQ